MNPDVIIVGGGVSGLAAAVRLSGAGARVTLLEQAQKLGGRCYSFRDPATGDIVDNGQHVLVGAYHRTLAYLETIGTRQFLTTEKGITFADPSEGRAVLRFPRLPAPFHVASGLLSFRLLPIADRWGCVRVGRHLRAWSEATERSLASQSVDIWLSSLGQSESARRVLWDPFCVSVMNERPESASALLFARSLRRAFFGVRDDAAVLIPTIGQSELYVEPACRLLLGAGARIIAGTEVDRITLERGKATGVRLADGTLMASGSVIAAVPPHALARMVPPEAAKAAPFDSLGAFASSPIVSVHLWFDREILDVDFIGLIGQDVQWVFNRRRITGGGSTAGYLSALISGAYRQVDLAKEELVELAIRDIASVAPECARARLLSSLVIKEKRATFSATAGAERLRPSAATPIGGFFLAGDWTDTGLPATIEGAITSGETAAARVVR